MSDQLKIMVSRHGAFYSPLIGVLAGGFLAEEGLEATYSVLEPGQRSRRLLREGRVDVVQSAVGSSFGPLAAGEGDMPLHFAQINRRDGFFLAARQPVGPFDWIQLEGRRLIADHGGQPLLMLRYAAQRKGVDLERVDLVDAGSPEEMVEAFRGGRGDFIHLQGPAPQQLELDGQATIVASVGEAMPEVAFSSLCAMPRFLQAAQAKAFTKAFRRAREWAQQASAKEIAAAEKDYFPLVSEAALAAAVDAYQKLGCWQGDLGISELAFSQAVEVFRAGGSLPAEPPFDQVVAPPPA